MIRMSWKRTASLTRSQTTHSGSSLFGAENGTSRLRDSPKHDPEILDEAMASGTGGTTPARCGRLPSCREGNKAEVGHPALPLF